MLVIFMIGIPIENSPGRKGHAHIVDSRAGKQPKKGDEMTPSSYGLGMTWFYSENKRNVF